MWKDSCEQLADYDAVRAEKEAEMVTLKLRIAELEARDHTPEPSLHGPGHPPHRLPESATPARLPRGPPVFSPVRL